MPLQLIPILYLVSLLPRAFSTGPISKPNCQNQCGSLRIPYPFGIGSGCSRDQYFDINCNTSTYPPKPYLTTINKEVIEINQTYIRVKYPNLASTCYDPYGDPGTNDDTTTLLSSESHTVNLLGTPYTLSSVNWLTAIGCDDVVLQSNESSRTGGGGCSAICSDKSNGGGTGYCPLDPLSLGDGCCHADINLEKTSLGAQLFDLSETLLRKRLFRCSYAFIQERTSPNETAFSYPLNYLDNYTTLMNDNWASATRPPVVRLDWNVGAENCSETNLNTSSTYACQGDKSVCVNSDLGYLCSCVPGYEGNPYLPKGCQKISFSSSIAKPNCQDQCGNLSIPFPFGIGPDCFLEPSFEILCLTFTNPPKGYLRIPFREIIELNATRVLVDYPNLGSNCLNSSNTSSVGSRSLIVNFSSTQYTLSDENWITTIGCGNMAVGVTGEDKRTSLRSSCAAICSNTNSGVYGFCPYGRTTYNPGDGCCRAPIPRGTNYLEANLTTLRGGWPRTDFSCGYAFISYDKINPIYFDWYEIANNKSADQITPYDWQRRLVLALDWRIGAVNCSEARRNSTSFMCQANSICVDFDATVKGYLCNCSKGYQGNPYLTPGCQDIDECADNTTNTCLSNSHCINTQGSYECSCSNGYSGDGQRYGNGCIPVPPSKSKVVILIGLGSGSGFLLLLLMCFWLYSVLQKREIKIVKEKFFKRNGGLLLQQQTNEGVIGKTKVFPSKELDVATDHFNESRILGQGGQGTVYKGMLSDGKIVAVKKSKLVEENQLGQFINEVAILSQINHRNVVKLLGCCLETEVPLLVYEFMPNGTLFDLLHDPNNEFPFTWNIRLKISADIAGALAYLHYACSIPIYHRDIKSSNILLDEKYVIKVSDFGTSMSVTTDQTHLTTMVKGTFGYLDPEYFQSSQFTEKSDVYSFGVVLVELLTGQRAISVDKTDKDRSLAMRFLTCMEENCIDKILDPRIWEDGRKDEMVLVARLAQRCLNLKGKMRPTMKEVAIELESFRMSQGVVKDEFEEVGAFGSKAMTISDSEYTWTSSCKSDPRSSSDSHPLMFTTE